MDSVVQEAVKRILTSTGFGNEYTEYEAEVIACIVLEVVAERMLIEGLRFTQWTKPLPLRGSVYKSNRHFLGLDAPAEIEKEGK